MLVTQDKKLGNVTEGQMPLKCVALKTPVSPGNVNVWLGFPSYTHLFPLLEVSHRNISFMSLNRCPSQELMLHSSQSIMIKSKGIVTYTLCVPQIAKIRVTKPNAKASASCKRMISFG